MRVLYLLAVYTHIVAAIVWVGTNIVLAVAVVPHLRDPELRGPVLALLRSAGPRLSRIGWSALAALLVTGTFNLYVRGYLTTDAMMSAASNPIGIAVLLKILGMSFVIALNVAHDLRWGPAAADAIERDPRGLQPETIRLRSLARYAGRFGTLVSLVLVAAGVVIVRGWF